MKDIDALTPTLSWIIGSSEFFHSFLFALQKIHSYQIPSQYMLARLLCRLDSALAKIRVLDLLHAHRVSPFVLRCRLVHLRIILLSTLLTFVTKSFGFLSLTAELETLRARSPFGLDSALQKIRLAPRAGFTSFTRRPSENPLQDDRSFLRKNTIIAFCSTHSLTQRTGGA